MCIRKVRIGDIILINQKEKEIWKEIKRAVSLAVF